MLIPPGSQRMVPGSFATVRFPRPHLLTPRPPTLSVSHTKGAVETIHVFILWSNANPRQIRVSREHEVLRYIQSIETSVANPLRGKYAVSFPTPYGVRATYGILSRYEFTSWL